MGDINLQSGIDNRGDGQIVMFIQDGEDSHVVTMNPETATRLAMDLLGQAVKADYSATLYKRLKAGGMGEEEISNLLSGIGDGD